MRTLSEFNGEIGACRKCALSAGRLQCVTGEGDPAAEIMLIGEAPGEQEDRCGKMFVGPAGQLLDKILAAISLRRDEIYLTNIIKCRPPANRAPASAEIAQCLPWLYGQLKLIEPKLILCLGKTAANAVLARQATLAQLRGGVYMAHGARAMVTYHPAALLRNPGWKGACWEDVKAFRRLYDELEIRSA